MEGATPHTRQYSRYKSDKNYSEDSRLATGALA
jgi:hypothetical protein